MVTGQLRRMCVLLPSPTDQPEKRFSAFRDALGPELKEGQVSRSWPARRPTPGAGTDSVCELTRFHFDEAHSSWTRSRSIPKWASPLLSGPRVCAQMRKRSFRHSSKIILARQPSTKDTEFRC